MHRLFLLDGMALAYRAHFAFMRNPITNSKGLNTSAVFGFTNTLLSIIENEKPTHLAVAFDTSAPTTRHKTYPEYKAQREAMPEELATAIPLIKNICSAFNIPVIEMDGYEADDIIGTLAYQAEQSGDFETYMVTPDKDFAQLVDQRTYMWKPGRKGNEKDVLGLPEILKNWEIETTKQVIDILGLWGDASDNIPGVPGIGEKTAKKLIAQFGSIENLIKNTDQLRGKQKENVINFSQQALLSKDLATIILDVPVTHTPHSLSLQEPDTDTLLPLFEDLEFRTLTKRLNKKNDNNSDLPSSSPKKNPSTQEKPSAPIFDSLKTIADVAHTYRLVQTDADYDELAQELLEADHFCFDVETTSLHRYSAELLGIAFSTQPHTGWYLPYEDSDTFRKKLRPALQNDSLKIAHNLKYDLNIMHRHDLEVGGPFFDTMLAHILAFPGQKHSMDYLAESLLGYSPIKLADVAALAENSDPTPSETEDLFTLSEKKETPKQKSKKAPLNIAGIPLDKLAQYAAEDADITLQLYRKLHNTLNELKIEHILHDIEAPLTPVIVKMEAEGIAIDLQVLSDIDRTLKSRISQLATDIRKEAGTDFNLNSPKQLGEILFGQMKLVEKPKKTKTGQYKTDEQTLTSLASEHKIVAHILSYRQATKLKSTYIDALPSHLEPTTGRVHTHLHQLIAGTGRMASSDPNLQNIPIRTPEGREIRKAFVPRSPEFTLLAADYSQVELRVIAALSNDATMIKAFRNGLDIHASTAAKVYNVSLDEVVPEMRRTAKTVNFGIIYGISAFGLSQRLGIPRGEASEIIETYFQQYPAIKKFMDDTIINAREKGYVETLSGRRCYFRELSSTNATVRANSERAAINAPIQGTAADMIKVAMIRVQQLLQNRKTKLLLQVHDELLFDLHLHEKEELIPQITKAMENAIALPNNVPVTIDTGTGDNWLEAH